MIPGLVNIQKTMENHHFSWENPLFLWSFSIATLNYQRVFPAINRTFIFLGDFPQQSVKEPDGRWEKIDTILE